MKGKSPLKSPTKTVKPGKASPSASQQQPTSTTGAEGKKNAPNKVRKLVYRHGGKTQQSAISVQQAAQAVMLQNLKGQSVKVGSGDEGLEPMSVQQAAEAVVLQNLKSSIKGKAKASSSETGADVESKPDSYTGKKIIKSIPGEPHIQEVQKEDGSFLNFRCKLCKVRFTDLKEIHMRGRRHRVNLENIQIKPKPPPTPPTAPASDPKAKPVKKRVPAKRIAPVLSRTPAIIHGLVKKNPVAVVKEKPKEKEPFSIYKLYREMKASFVISDRWCIPEPLWDPHTNREVLLCYELDVLMDGSVRMKRCLKVLDNFELIVNLDGTDKTHIFKDKHPTIKSTQDMLDLIRKVTMVKVCSGIKDCDPNDFDNITVRVIERGGSWYSSECNVEVERGCLGNICKKCTSLRNTLRRKMRRQFGLDSTTSNSTPSRTLLSNTMKPVLRSVGEALYLNLQHMSGSNRISVSEEEEMPPPPRSSNQVLHPELGIYMNEDLKERLEDLAANPPPPITKIEHIVEFDPRTNTKTLKRIHTPVAPSSLRGSTSALARSSIGGSKRIRTDLMPNQSYVMGNNGELTLVQTQNGDTIQLPEGYVLADDGQQWGDGNIVVQKLPDGQDEQYILGDDNSIIQVGNNFTLEDGEEYEVIGEAASGAEGDAIQVLPLATNSDIEIIEVDENMIQLVDENSQPPEITPVDSNSDIFKFLQAHSRLQQGM